MMGFIIWRLEDISKVLDISRKELKYDVNFVEAANLKSRLVRIMKADIHNGINGYTVRSLYFDTLRDTDFEEKVDGYDDRRKIRLRIYNASSETIKLEVKEKKDGMQRKRSLLLDREEARRMEQADYTFLTRRKEPLSGWLYTYMTGRCYRPKCVVEYDRFACMLSSNDTRVTFDSRLRASECGLALFDSQAVLYPVSSPDEITMEVKYNGFLMTYVKNELSLYNKMQRSASKYCRARMISKKGRK